MEGRKGTREGRKIIVQRESLKGKVSERGKELGSGGVKRMERDQRKKKKAGGWERKSA